MKIGEEVYIHGFIDEIRQDSVIIRNDGGYFGTVASELRTAIPETQGKSILNNIPVYEVYENQESMDAVVIKVPKVWWESKNND